MKIERYAQIPMDNEAELKNLFEHVCEKLKVDAAAIRQELKATSKVTIPSLQKLGKKLGIRLVFDYRENLIEAWYTEEVGDQPATEAPAPEAKMNVVPPEGPKAEEPATEEPAGDPPTAPPATPAIAAEAAVAPPVAPEVPAAPTAPEVPAVAPPAPAIPTAAPAEVPGAEESLVKPEVPVAPAAPATPPPGDGTAFQTVKDPDVTGEDAKEDDEPF